jgi:hypothetical protein
MKKFIKNIFYQFIIVFVLLYPLKYLVMYKEQKLISSGIETNFIKWSNFSNLESCNTVFIGSSKIYCSIRPSLFDSITTLKSYNLGTGSQSIIESFYYLKYATNIHNIKYVIVDLRIESFNKIDFMHLRNNMKYLDCSNKYPLYYHSGLAKNIFCELIPGLEYSGYIFELYRMFQINLDNANEFKNKWEKGFQQSVETYESYYAENKKNSKIENIKINAVKNLEYLDALISLCKEKNIKLIFTNIPQGLSEVATLNESIFFDRYFKKYGEVNFFYNYPSIKLNHVRKDGWHLNNNGAKIITITLARYINLLNSNSRFDNQDSN